MLYRYIFRGLGILMAVGMITILLLAVISQARHTGPSQSRGTTAGASR